MRCVWWRPSRNHGGIFLGQLARSCLSRTFHRRLTGRHTGHCQVLAQPSVAIIPLIFRARPTAWHFQHSTSQARISFSCGSQLPLEQNLQDKILRGEYSDFSLLLSDSLARPQAPDIQLRVDDLIPGSSPVTMVCKRKPVIDSFYKWLDTFTAYALVIVGSHPRRSLELFKYQQIISRGASKLQGTAFLAYDKHFRRQAASDLRISWDQVNIELWTVTFSGLAKPHCLVCSSPHHSQSSCPNADPFHQSHKNGPVCFRFNRSSRCNSHPCPFPYVCRRCRSADHSIVACPSSFSKANRRSNGSSNTSDRSKR